MSKQTPGPWRWVTYGTSTHLRGAADEPVMGFYKADGYVWDGDKDCEDAADIAASPNGELIAQAPTLYERLLRSEQLNAELARMLAEWEQAENDSGRYCCGINCDDGTEHAEHCLRGRTAALLKKARTE